MAAKNNQSASEIDKTSFFWTSLCGICHPGGGPGEFDRDGYKYYDVVTKKFGYETAGKQPNAFDGDYALVSNKTGALSNAPWDITGVSEPDCLMCHRTERTINGQKNMNWIWRTASLRATSNLTDGAGKSVPAFATAPTAGQGWFSKFEMIPQPAGKPPMAGVVKIDYKVGIQRGELIDEAGELKLRGTSISGTPKDYACWGCHLKPDMKKRGRFWFSKDVDVHYAAFNNLNDADAGNDIEPLNSIACQRCHETGMDHNIGKGNANLGSVQNETDYVGLKDCIDCHDPNRSGYDPEAPVPKSQIHTEPRHQATMSCQFCHIPHRIGNADLVVDIASTGSTIAFKTNDFLSADPLDPSSADRSHWYPHFKAKEGKFGGMKYFPVKNLLSIWWGDWDDRGTSQKSDDAIAPIALWRVRQVTKGKALAGVTDDNKDGRPEVNRRAEIALYLKALKQKDSYGNPIAKRPVLVKGGHVYFEDAGAPGGVGDFEYHGTGLKTESSHPFSIDHNVLPAKVALGSTSCGECHKLHNNMLPTPVIDRLILVDPYGEDGKPVYKSIRELTGLRPF